MAGVRGLAEEGRVVAGHLARRRSCPPAPRPHMSPGSQAPARSASASPIRTSIAFSTWPPRPRTQYSYRLKPGRAVRHPSVPAARRARRSRMRAKPSHRSACGCMADALTAPTTAVPSRPARAAPLLRVRPRVPVRGPVMLSPSRGRARQLLLPPAPDRRRTPGHARLRNERDPGRSCLVCPLAFRLRCPRDEPTWSPRVSWMVGVSGVASHFWMGSYSGMAWSGAKALVTPLWLGGRVLAGLRVGRRCRSRRGLPMALAIAEPLRRRRAGHDARRQQAPAVPAVLAARRRARAPAPGRGRLRDAHGGGRRIPDPADGRCPPRCRGPARARERARPSRPARWASAGALRSRSRS